MSGVVEHRVERRDFMVQDEHYGKEDKIIPEDKLFKKALEKYIEYLETKTKAMDIDEEISKKMPSELYEDISGLLEESPELRKEVQELREESRELHEAALKLYDTCKFYFQGAFDKYKETEKIGLASERNRLFRSWGNAEYALAIINKRETFYKDAKNYFKKAKLKYEQIINKDDVVLRRLGNACYELAAIEMDNSSYKDAKGYFEEAIENYEKIDMNTNGCVIEEEDNIYVEIKRNWGNALFELGRIEWRNYLFLKENKDPSYKKSIKNEAADLPSYNGCKIRNIGDEVYEFLSRKDTENINEKLKSSYENAEKHLKAADEKYKEIGKEKIKKEKYADVFHSWGEIYSLFGRKNRYDYLSIQEKIKTLRENEKKNKKSIEIAKNKIKKNIESAIKNFRIAIDYFEEAKNLAEENKEKEREIEIWYILGATYYRLYLTYSIIGYKNLVKAKKARQDAIRVFKDSKSTILDILVDLSMDVAYSMANEDILFSLLEDLENNDAVFFKSIIESEDKNVVKSKIKKNEYKKIYIRSMYIISLLEVKSEHEQVVAHYTKKSISQRMLFDDKKFWLFAIDYFNDPTCGKILFSYLFGQDKNEEQLNKEKNEKKVEKSEERPEYVTCAGSFSFNYDSLNQFRLYGKENDREGTGLSLVFNKTFFSEEFKQDRAAFLREFSKELLVYFGESKKENFERLLKQPLKKPRKNTLFRCVYFDPETNRVETVGQKEKYLFYREEKNEADRIIKKNEKEFTDNEKKEIYRKRKKIANEKHSEYTNFIRNLVNDINDELEELKNLVDKFEDKAVVIGQLILKLRYLIKHVAFKVEQECRIVKNCRIDNKDEISIGSSDKTLIDDLKMHYEYDLKVSQHVENIYFGPNATEIEVFKKCLKHKDLHGIICEKSTNPLA